MDAVVSFILERWPVIIVAIVAIVITYWFCKLYFGRFIPVEKKVNDADTKLKDFDAVNNKVENLPCDKHGRMFEEIMEAITEIRTYLMVKNPKTAALFSQKHSPRELNEAGKQLLADINGEEFLNKNKETLIKGIDDKTPKTALDVEESALEVLYSLIDNDMFIDIKNWVYNSPSRKLTIDGVEREYTITMNDVCFVLSLPLRNMYLAQHPELQH